MNHPDHSEPRKHKESPMQLLPKRDASSSKPTVNTETNDKSIPKTDFKNSGIIKKLKPVKTYSKVCLQCDTPFEAKKSFAKYCKVACKTAYLKTHSTTKKPQLLKLYNKKFLSEDLLTQIRYWNKIPNIHKKVILDKASFLEAVSKLKEMGYHESMAFKPFSISDDGKIMVTMNLIQKYRIEALI